MLGRKNPEEMTEREKVARRRKEVLSRGRKFKYPLQYAKHRIAIIASIISVVAVAALLFLGYASLYMMNSSNDVIYRVTQVLPVPVASVDGATARYSDYLLFYRSSIAAITEDENFAETKAEYQRAALDSVEEYAYAEKLAAELGITVSDEEIDDLFRRHLTAGGTERSEASFLKILEDNFGLSKSEYRRMLYLLLIRSKVAVAIDDDALRLAEQVAVAISALGGNLSAVADNIGESVIYDDTGGLVDYDTIDGGRASMALKLEPGEISERFVSTSGDAYYIVKLIEKTDTEVNYVSLEIPFTEFVKRFTAVMEANNYQEYITF